MALTLDGAGRIVQLQDYDDEAVAERDLGRRARGAAGGEPPATEVVSGFALFVQVTDMQRSLPFYELRGFTVADSFALRARRSGRRCDPRTPRSCSPRSMRTRW